MNRLSFALVSSCVLAFLSWSPATADEPARCSVQPIGDQNARSKVYISNRAPLTPQPLVKLPAGSIEPRGWLRTQLNGMRDGFVGHLDEISRFCRDDSAWMHPDGKRGWEEVPYWLKGYVDLGYVLNDPEIISTSKNWLNAIIASAQPDGYFGPTSNKKSNDAWPNMIILDPLRTLYDATGDARVIPLMTKYFEYRNKQSDDELFPSQWGKPPFSNKWWQHVRASDELQSIYWLYNRTGDKWLLDYALRIHRLSGDWKNNIPSWHGVNICQGFRAPAIYYQQSHDKSDITGAMASLKQVYDLYGQVPGGMFGADEDCRIGYGDPRQAAETCSMAEMMFSCESLLEVTGQTDFANRCENVAFNSLPASMTPDLKALHYLTSPNMIQLDRHNKAPGIENGGCMVAYSPHDYRCCQHNVAMSWPYFCESLIMATSDGGAAAVMYAPCKAKLKVANANEVEILEETDYPFKDTVRFTISTTKPVRFPFAMRVPDWCESPRVTVNGEFVDVAGKPDHYIILDRDWSNGDKIELTLPMHVEIKRWKANHDAVSVVRGPLTYSLKIGERWAKYDDDARQNFADADKWPSWEVFPTTPWNYGLVLDDQPAAEQFKIHVIDKPLADQPFDIDTAPITIEANAQRITNWTADRNNLVRPLQQSPAKVVELQPEKITLIPMGCARLRISAFPTVSAAPNAHDWTLPPKIPHQASHENDDLRALSDGKLPRSSNDYGIPRFTWWPRRGTTEWVTWQFKSPRKVSHVKVYWFDDEGHGYCRTPSAWRIYYRDGDAWKPATSKSADPISKDTFNEMTIEPVTTSELKLEVDLRDGFSCGILEWTAGE